MCPDTSNAEKEIEKEMEVQGEANGPLIRPEILEPFGNWMIAEKRARRPMRRMVADHYLTV